jgi:uncharacterized membrane protein YhaH (DUF805 family)
VDKSWTSNEFLFSFEGRINRARYWYALYASMINGLFFLAIWAFVLGAIFGVSVTSVHLDIYDVFNNPPSLPFRVDFSSGGHTWLVSVLFYAGGTPIFIAAIRILAATTLKRLHDRNKSGWWIVPFFLAPNLLHKAGDWLGDSYLAGFVMLFMLALSLWGFVEMLCLRGTRGPNRFGPDPLGTVIRSPRAVPNWDQLRELEFVPHSAGPSPGEHVKRGHD